MNWPTPMSQVKGCIGDHIAYDEDDCEYYEEGSREIGNKFEIFKRFFFELLIHEDSAIDHDYVIEMEPTCTDCNEKIADGAEGRFDTPDTVSGFYGADVEGTPSATSDSLWFKVDYGNGWKFDVRISESRD